MSNLPGSNQKLDSILLDISWLKTSEGIYRFNRIDALTPPGKEGDHWVLTVSGEPVFLEAEEAVEIEKLLKPCVDVRGERKEDDLDKNFYDILLAILSQSSSFEPCSEYFKSKGFSSRMASLLSPLEEDEYGFDAYILYLMKDDETRKYAGSSIAECLLKGIKLMQKNQ